MNSNTPLRTIQTTKDNLPKGDKNSSNKSSTTRLDTQAKFERLWLTDPERFDPARNSMETLRIERTMEFIQSTKNFQEKKCVDLGCGIGLLTFFLRDLGAQVDAVDIAENALKKLKAKDIKNIRLLQDYVPATKLADDLYDLVLCTELIGELRPEEHRLFCSELARIVHRDGFIICSSPLDINTEAPLEKLLGLMEIEFAVEKILVSHHRWWILLNKFLSIPEYYVSASQNPSLRKDALLQRKGFSYFWYKVQTTFPMAYVWRFFDLFFKPIKNFVKHSRFILLQLEKFCRFLSPEKGISHVILLAKRRALFNPIDEVKEAPIERRHKKQVWE